MKTFFSNKDGVPKFLLKKPIERKQCDVVWNEILCRFE